MKVCRRARFWKNGLARKRERFDNGGMAMGTRKQQERQEGLWIATADLPRSGGHPFYERLNELLAEAEYDTFVEERCRKFYAPKMGRPSLAPGIYFRLLLVGYFEGLDSERGIAWRAADSLGLRRFLRIGLEEAPPDHSTISRTRRLIDVETHRDVFTWVLGMIAGKGLLAGKTLGIDATTLEANAALRSIVRRESGESYVEFLTKLAQESGIETPTREELARLDRKRKQKGSNREWVNQHDPEARITKMKDGRTHLAHKAEHAVDLETGAVVAVTVQGADQGDTTTIKETFIEAAEQVEAAGEEPTADEERKARGLQEVVTDKGYHSGALLEDWGEIGVRSYISEPQRGRRKWNGKRGQQAAVYGNRRRIRGERGKQLLRRRGEFLERTFAHVYDTGGMRRTHLRGHRNILKRLLIHVAAFNLSLILRREIGVGTPRGLQDLRNHLFFCFYAVWMVLESCSESHHHPQELSPVQWTVLPSLGYQRNAA